ncbi:spore protease YyaC [Salipaludibacillus keqinensis]|uniref:Spore protease YyaC n=1 Tax=Salipaludibacillus keqinensis TaxID=2045207 RepID=A0A323T6B3_9BACI|nr:spore protease YyaC [Salipaludibacillus keqinensis]PYZ91788.1 spore protease YyaC [Salipaludibacillus keqinensis]
MNYGQLFKEKNQPSGRYHIHEPLAIQHMAKTIFSFLPIEPDTPITVVCIGSDRSTGDSLGPLIGTKLLERRCPSFSVFGTLNSPVHAKNLEETLESIHQTERKPWIIALDACLGRTESVGYMTVNNGPVYPGVAVKKQLPPVGDMHMTGIVNVAGYMEMLVLQNTRLSLVMDMANAMSGALLRAACWHERRQEVLYPSAERKIT